ncbi:ubiquinol-cytochrome c reductase iron-sulfur subunit [Candidatus Nitronereus thalassa]|uniref:Ubiquinol-cytochrome c reductase iron-sulfur subunit n=1 Tax=Candidatus Nitronereus thalassa TaxID=3020898 RepID=A0ABU3KA01_9BACT|nr:ubiquinol-cytochrome c reductase iron-sulfur subunit [Candidatus Nitronereus thalassa]MDT7043123.1 ubiquinol-cytochrome c reductase iron-sulfur subunit [Candidatus Nitronereus thalassa]
MNHFTPHEPHETPEGFSTPVGSRRTFFQWVTGAIAGVIGLSLAIPLAGYFISPALTRRKQSWVSIGKVEDLPVGIPKTLDYGMTIKDGWMETKTIKAVWVVRQPDDQVKVFSPICPHLGCGFRWNQQDSQFTCPCHGSVYDPMGKVLGGPAPRSLDELPSKIEDGELKVIYKEYKSGLSKQVEL